MSFYVLSQSTKGREKGRVMTILVAAMAASFLWLGGCATTRIVTVDALNDPEIDAGVRYILLSSMPDVSREDLIFREVARHLREPLIEAGFSEADSLEEADFLLFLSFGTGNPRMIERVYTFPVYLERGGHVTTVTRTTTDASGTTTQRIERIVEPARSEVAVLERERVLITVFPQFLTLSARKKPSLPESPRPTPEIWRLTAELEEETRDFRGALSSLSQASAPWIGQSTPAQIQVRIKN